MKSKLFFDCIAPMFVLHCVMQKKLSNHLNQSICNVIIIFQDLMAKTSILCPFVSFLVVSSVKLTTSHLVPFKHI